MANKKKTNKKVTPKKVTKKKEVKKVETKKVEITPKESKLQELKSLGITVGIIILVFLVVYILTLGAKKLGWFDPRYEKTTPEEAVFSNEYILAGEMFSMSTNNYYVVIADFSSDESIYLDSIINNYEGKTIYKVDLSDGFNKYLVSEEVNVSAQNASDLKINDITLIEVNNNRNVKYVIGIDNIKEVLK